MQVLDVSCSVGSALPVPLTACMTSAVGGVDSACSVLVHDHNAVRGVFGDGLSPSWKAVVDPTCTLDRVYSGLCSACTAADAMAGRCPPGTHTFMLDMVLPDGLEPGTTIAMVFRVGAPLLSAKVMIQFEMISDTRDLPGNVSEASDRLQSMLLSSKVCFYNSEVASHTIVSPCVIVILLCSSVHSFALHLSDSASRHIKRTNVLFLSVADLCMLILHCSCMRCLGAK
jgi:hypothetical protein